MVLPQGFMLTRSSEIAHDVYFLTRGVASLVVTLREGESAEVGMLGNEGMIGSTGLLGSSTPTADCIMQMPGAGFRLPIIEMKRLFEESTEVRTLVLQAIQRELLTISQIAACNRLHNATERLARWLLTAADRAETDSVPLTQEAVAEMLGTRRTTIALVAASLQRSGLIRYHRGHVRVTDYAGLATAACDCYRVIKSMTDCLYSRPPLRPSAACASYHGVVPRPYGSSHYS